MNQKQKKKGVGGINQSCFEERLHHLGISLEEAHQNRCWPEPRLSIEIQKEDDRILNQENKQKQQTVPGYWPEVCPIVQKNKVMKRRMEQKKQQALNKKRRKNNNGDAIILANI
jgi:hypothetical protein